MSGSLREKIVRDYQSGSGANTVAAKHGVTTSCVYYHLKRSGIPRREPKEAQRRKLTGKKLERVLTLNRNGMSASQIAEKVGTTVNTVLSALRREGIDGFKRGQKFKFDEAKSSEVLALYKAGNSQQRIASQFGVSQPFIGRLLKRLGVPAYDRKPNMRSEDHGAWKGGRTTNRQGYVLVMPKETDEIGAAMVNGEGYVQEHRLAMAHELGRPLHQHETVHHIDGNRRNNKVSNLQLRFGKHGKHIAYECAACGSRNIRPISID
jgi:transposase